MNDLKKVEAIYTGGVQKFLRRNSAVVDKDSNNARLENRFLVKKKYAFIYIMFFFYK